jgi:hypothetical protein
LKPVLRHDGVRDIAFNKLRDLAVRLPKTLDDLACERNSRYFDRGGASGFCSGCVHCGGGWVARGEKTAGDGGYSSGKQIKQPRHIARIAVKMYGHAGIRTLVDCEYRSFIYTFGASLVDENRGDEGKPSTPTSPTSGRWLFAKT